MQVSAIACHGFVEVGRLRSITWLLGDTGLLILRKALWSSVSGGQVTDVQSVCSDGLSSLHLRRSARAPGTGGEFQ